jgi:RNA polymerase sigma factor (sigma-70 family)
MPTLDEITAEQDQLIAQAIEKDGSRLRSYIRRRVVDQDSTEDILQEVFSELIEAYRLVKPIEQVSAWLFRVAKNRIIDSFRGRKLASLSQAAYGDEEDTAVPLEDLLPSPESSPEAAYARRVLLDELDEALAELPEEQRSVFIAHEWEGYTFKELAAQTGVSVNTLLSRKRYAVLHLRQRLQSIYDEFVKK